MDSDDLQAVQGPPVSVANSAVNAFGNSHTTCARKTAASIQNLLNSLRNSSAWAQAVGAAPIAVNDTDQFTHTTNPESHHLGESTETLAPAHTATSVPTDSPSLTHASTPILPPPSVASLLSQLQASSGNIFTPPALSAPSSHTQYGHNHALQTQEHDPMLENRRTPAVPSDPSQQKDFRTMTFQKSLAHVATLAEDEAFVQAMKSVCVFTVILADMKLHLCADEK